MLIQDFGVLRVVVSEIFTRERPRILSATDAAHKRKHANEIFNTLLQTQPRIRFWSHKRIFGAQTPVFTADGVHLTSFGQRRLYKSIHLAVKIVLQDLF